MNRFVVYSAILLAVMGSASWAQNNQAAVRMNQRQLADYERQLKIPRSTTRISLRNQSPEISCRVDSKTGCHFGHDEKSHPGGCRCGQP